MLCAVTHFVAYIKAAVFASSFNNTREVLTDTLLRRNPGAR